MSVSVMDIALQGIDCLIIFCAKLNFSPSDSNPATVIPAKAGIHFESTQKVKIHWIPACAGMTEQK